MLVADTLGEVNASMRPISEERDLDCLHVGEGRSSTSEDRLHEEMSVHKLLKAAIETIYLRRLDQKLVFTSIFG